MTLIEILFATVTGMMVMAAVVSLMIYTARTFAAVANYADMDRQSRNAIDLITSQVRKMDSLTSISSNSISFTRAGTNLSFVYNPANTTLSQVSGATTTLLLTNCDNIAFAIYQRNTISNTFNQFPTSVASNTCKVVQINWTCSRNIMGQKRNTEMEQTAKVVIRREK
jgi:hypothetical protein